MLALKALKLSLGVGMLAATVGCPAPCPQPPSTCTPTMTPLCTWGANAPAVWPASAQVMMTPTVMSLNGANNPPQIAFVSFESATDATNDAGGVLRIIDGNCQEIARFPDTSANPPPLPPSCATAYPNLNSVPHLSPTSGLALGNIDGNPSDVEIIGVLDDHTTNNGGLIAFHLVGNSLIPLWCSTPLPLGDFIPRSSAPAIAQLDSGPLSQPEIVIDNKVFDSNGQLRYTGFSGGGNNCGAGGPCPRSHTTLVANLTGAPLPQIITGRGIYDSQNATTWTGPTNLPTINPNVSNLSPGLTFPAIAELDPSPGAEIIVADTMTSTLYVLNATGATLASIAIPSPGFTNPQCGGPPVIGNFNGVAGSEIGVASCNRFTAFTYTPGTLAQLWSTTTNDPSGQTTGALLITPAGPRLYYADADALWVLNAINGNVLQCAQNTSATAFEGPVIAGLDPGQIGHAKIIVAANNYNLTVNCGQRGIRIFHQPFLARNVWNQHTYHRTNVNDSWGTIPVTEPPSWIPPAPNTYRAQ